jgi:outer membrane protein, heavy metal efflux system
VKNFLHRSRYRTALFWAFRSLCWILCGAGQRTAAGHIDSPLAPGQKLSLAQAQEIAFRRNWDLLAAAAGVDAATAQKIVAREFPNPILSASTQKMSVDNHPSSTEAGNGFWDRSYDTIIAINQLFEIGGKRAHRQASAQANYEAARAQFLDSRRTLELAVTKSYIAATQADENVLTLTQSAGTLRQEATLAEIRLRAGEISAADKGQIEITADRFELDARSAQSAAAQARVALEVLLGVPRPRGDIVLSDTLENLTAKIPGSDSVSFPERRPDLVAAEAVLKKTEADLRLQKSNRIPDPTLLAQYEHEPADQPNTIGLGVSFPLPLWNRNAGNIAAAAAAVEQARVAYDKARAQAGADVATARLVYEDALKRFHDYRQSIRPKSEEVRKAISFAFEKGGSSLLDLLLAERNDNEVRLAAAQSAADLAAAIATMKAATTEISKGQTIK